MTIIYRIIEWAACFVELYIFYSIYGDVFGNMQVHNQKKTNILLAVIGMILVRLCNHVAAFSYLTIMVIIFYTSVSSYGVYKKNYLLNFSVSSFYILCLSCFDFLIFTFLSNLFNGYSTFIELVTQESFLRTIVIFSIKVLWILSYVMIRRKLQVFSKMHNHFKMLFIMTGVGYASFVYLVNQTFKAFGNETTNLWFVFIVVFALVLVIVMLSNEIKTERMKSNLAELRYELMEEKYDLVSDIYKKNAKLYHDLNKHMNILYQLLETEKIVSAKEYIEEISSLITKLTKTNWTGIDVIDAIINSEWDKMKDYGITADLNVEFPQGTNLLPTDMCTILANILDNAIEATQKLEYPERISLTMRVINQLLIVKVENKCVDDKINFVHFPKTTKQNKELHGWGLPCVDETVQKYHGKMICAKENGKFVVTIMMPFELTDC